MPHALAELTAIKETLAVASDHGLEAEVLWSAFRALRARPELTLSEALDEGLAEWDLL